MDRVSSAAQLVERAAAVDSARGVWFVRDLAADRGSGGHPAPAPVSPVSFTPFAAIDRRASGLAGALRRLDLRRGDRLAFIIPSAELSLPLFFGALRAGLALVPIAPPTVSGQLGSYGELVTRALRETAPAALVAGARVRRLLEATPLPARLLSLEELGGGPDEDGPERVAGGDLALLLPGVEGRPALALTHADVLGALAGAQRALQPSVDDVFVSWLPPFEEAGLIAALLPFHAARSAALLSPVQFLRSPGSWLHAITRARGTISFAPGHAYAFCARRVGADERAGLDLSSWRVAGWTGEPVPHEAAEAFAAAFAGARFRASAFTGAELSPRRAPARPAARGEAPLSRGQEALWFLAQLAPDSVAYNVPLCFRLTSPFDAGALRRAFQAIVDRHAALRTVFRSRAGAPYRVVMEGCEVAFEEIDASGWSGAALAERLNDEAARPFDLERGPLFQVRLFSTGPSGGVLLLLAHHIAVDVHSLGIIASDLASLYPALARGDDPALPAPVHSYDEFAAWQAQLLAGPQGRRMREHWAARLAGAPAALALATDRPRPAFQSHRGAALPFELDAALAGELRALARRHDTTLYTVLLAVYHALLHLSTGQRDILVASPASGRSGAAFEGVVGYFVNTIPIRARVEPATTFAELVGELRAAVLEALDHQDLPFPLIVEAAGAPRDPGRSPLCQVMFALQNPRLHQSARDLMKAVFGRRADLGGLAVEPVELDRRFAQFDMTLMLAEVDESIAGFYEYNTDLFERSTAGRFLADFTALARALVREPGARIASHRLASAPRRAARDWNATDTAYPDGRVHRAFEREAVRRPDAIALVFGEDRLTYGELNRRANRLARHLRAGGVGRGSLVGVAMDRSLDLVTALLAVVKAGAAYVPLDPTYPAERVRFLVDDARPGLVIADPDHAAPAGAGGAEVLVTPSARAIACSRAIDAVDLEVDAAPGDLVYVIYTSGSTGAPKGAGNSHAGLWNRLCWMQERYRLGEADCVLQKTPYSFDVSVWEFFWPLMAGARLGIARPGGHRDSAYLLAEIDRLGVTTIHFVPSMLEAFLQEPAVGAAAGRLARVIASGEALPHALMMRFFDRLPGVELHNLYGPTEASIDVTAWACEPTAGAVPIGRPIANTQIHILDGRLARVAAGAEGEIYIGGVGLARGYHRRPALTAERFVPDPSARTPGGRLYRTGDLARAGEDGLIEYRGRNDDQVKIRGFRIELGEIEAAVRAHPAVVECVAVARRMPAGGARLEVFIVPSPRATLDTAALGALLRERLPEHMVPGRLELVGAIPLTHSGKADRRALLARGAGDEPGARPAAPRTAEEEALVEIWQEVLGRQRVGVHDNYFALGGDSIRSLQMRALARARGLDFDVQALFARQTVAELAEVVRREAPAREERVAPFALVPAADLARLPPCQDAFPATQLQVGMLYHASLGREAGMYHDILGFDLEMEWREPAMREALGRVMRRHPALRSSFDVAGASRPLQIVHRDAPVPLAARDLRSLGPEAAAAAIREHVERDRAAGYRIDAAPLFRVMVHVLGERRVRLTLSFHHAILDGWSTATLVRELLVEYLRAIGATRLAPFRAPAHSPGEFAALEAEATASEESRAFWRERLADSELATLPRRPDPARAGAAAGRLVVEIDRELFARLGEAAARLGAPLKSLLLAAHARAIAAFTGSDDVVTGVVTHGRPEVADADRILGLFLNTAPLRVGLAGVSWAELIERITRAEAETYPHRRFPLREIQRLLERGALFETAFNFVSFHIYDPLLADGAVRVLGYDVHESTNFALLASFVLSPIDGQLSLHLEYDAGEIAGELAERVARGHILALAALAGDATAPAGLAPVVDAAERERVVVAWNRSGRAGQPAPVHALVERQAARTPGAIAVQLGRAALTYAELDALASDAARRLAAAGARPGEAIAVAAEPSLERAVAVVGALKAGCAYLPLDPSYPLERLHAMLELAGARVALASPSLAGARFLAGLTALELDARRGGGEGAAPGHASSPDDPAYVIFTSGSTGRPKGIAMPHGALANLVAWQIAESGEQAGATTAQFSSFSFDVSFQEIFSTWAAGGRLVMIPDRCRADARELARLLAEERVARLFAPVVALHQLVEVAEELRLALPDLREIDTAGEQLEIHPPVRAFFRRHPACRLSNHYGPSETHVATCHRLGPDPDAWPFAPPIGRPLPGVRAYILDGQGQPAPIGVAGELYLAGACVAIGYWREPALTAERFTRDPFAPPGSSERMYRTGDRARFLSDGTIEFLGRRDGQVKIRGYRVELAEVEAALVAAGGGRVRRAAVIAGPAASGRRELAAYVVPAAGASLDLAGLRDAMARALPAHMIPASVTALDALPRTPSGKIDRRSLPRAASAAPGERARAAPEGALEAELARVWQDVLAAPDLGATDSFFERGGDSLSAVRLMARIERRLGVSLPISALLAAPTIRQLARAIESAAADRDGRSLVAIRAGGSRPPLFCVHPIGGNVLCYAPLAARLGADQPLFGLEARGLDGRPPRGSIAEMAAAYAAEIAAVQPSGPVHVAGWSFGGVVAIEIARELGGAGRELAPVVLLDSVAAMTWKVELSDEHVHEWLALERDLVPGGPESGAQPAWAAAVMRANLRAILEHQQRAYRGPVVLVRSTDPMPARLQRLHDLLGAARGDGANGWSAWCPRLTVVPAGGDHLTLVREPHVGRVAEVVREVIDAAAADRPADHTGEMDRHGAA